MYNDKFFKDLYPKFVVGVFIFSLSLLLLYSLLLQLPEKEVNIEIIKMKKKYIKIKNGKKIYLNFKLNFK